MFIGFSFRQDSCYFTLPGGKCACFRVCFWAISVQVRKQGAESGEQVFDEAKRMKRISQLDAPHFEPVWTWGRGGNCVESVKFFEEQFISRLGPGAARGLNPRVVLIL
jgi:hypothetical protein